MSSPTSEWLARIQRGLKEVARRPSRAPELAARWAKGMRTSQAEPSPNEEPVPDPPPAPSARPFAYPELRIAVAGKSPFFSSIVPMTDLTSGRQPSQPGTFDFVLVEPGAGQGPSGDRLEQLRGIEAPVVLLATSPRHLEPDWDEVADVVVLPRESVGAGAAGSAKRLVFDPSVEVTVDNPVGWLRQPDNDLLVLADDSAASIASALGERAQIHGATRYLATGSEATALAKSYRGAYLSPVDAGDDFVILALRLTAAGTPVISPRSASLDLLLDGHYLPADSPEQVKAALDQLMDDGIRERLSVRARRHVLMTHSRLRRLEQILEHLHIPVEPPPRVSVIVATNRPEQVSHVLSNVSGQNWPDKELVLAVHGAPRFDVPRLEADLSEMGFPASVIPCPAAWTLGDCLNAALKKTTGRFVTKMDDDDHYGPEHLTDLVVAHSYADAAAVGKLANPTFLVQRNLTVDWRIDDQERYVHHLPGATMLIERALLDRYRFSRVNQGVDTALWERMTADGHRLYSTHWLNFVRVRHGSNTYVRDDEDFLGLATISPIPGLNADGWFS